MKPNTAELSEQGQVRGWPNLKVSEAYERAQVDADNSAAVLALPDGSLNSVDSAIAALIEVVLTLYPAWLPDAEGIESPAGLGRAAVTGLARAEAARGRLFGPVLERFAHAALERRGFIKWNDLPREVVVRECGKLIRAAYRLPDLVVVVAAPIATGTPSIGVEETALWLAPLLPAAIWIAGPTTNTMTRISIPDITAGGALQNNDPPVEPLDPLPWATPLAGRPNPFSVVEQRLEAYLQPQPWSTGRAWNASWQTGPTSNSILVDLLWETERLVVELDGAEHRGIEKFEADRRRDRLLQLAGYAVLRFTNAEVLSDIEMVASHIERFLKDRRAAPES
jgi:hypothetical protein